MARASKIILIVAVSVVGLLVLASVGASLLLGASVRPRLQEMASDALDMEVKVGGRFAVRLLPRLHVALADVRAHKNGTDVASAKEVELGIALLPLLHRELRIESVVLRGLRITVERDSNGKLNIARSTRATGAHRALVIEKASMRDATVVYADERSGKRLEATGCQVDAGRMRVSPGQGLMKHLSLSSAQAACAQVKTQEFAADDVKFMTRAKDGGLDFDPVTLRLFGGQGSGAVRADFSGAVPVYGVHYRLEKFRVEEALDAISPQKLGPKNIGSGAMEFSATMSFQGTTFAALRRSADGEASLHGENLKLNVGNLDEKFARYESSQTFNLVDVGAVFFAGPVGLGVTKGYNFARIFQGTDGSTDVRTVVSHWKVERGVAHAIDVAMATPKNRVALQGGLDFVNDRFDEVTVALLDAAGCSRVQQKIRGSFHQPEVEKPNVLVALTGPTRKLLKKAEGVFGAKCDPFYRGSVAAPK